MEQIHIQKQSTEKTNDKKYETISIFDTEYVHVQLENKDDLYITKYGLPFIEILEPDNYWTDENWFQQNSVRLSGTSSIYKIRTKKVNGKQKDIVIKWNRMGQDIPGELECEELAYAEFNSPFEEFSLVMELRKACDTAQCEKIYTQKPLAIYTPYKKVDLWRTGRKAYKLKSKINSHKDVELDIFRLYAVIYEWIKGIDAVQACQEGFLDKDYMEFLTLQVESKIGMRGFTVRDRKPDHIIVRPENNKHLKKDKTGAILYGLIDFELLQRTPEREKQLKQTRRHNYLIRQRDRFTKQVESKFHPHLKKVNIFNIDYMYGHVESTKGALWVVGDDPFLFDYFLPERWEKTPKTKLSRLSQVYHTVTKDAINLVWKVCKVGIQPSMDPFKTEEKMIMEYGYNSPFEEFSIAMELNSKGIPTIYPRAIYMRGSKTFISKSFLDNTRYESHKNILTPDGNPILKKDRDYIIIWGFWNGPDEKLAAKDGDYYQGINALFAYQNGIITEKKYLYFLQMIKEKLFSIDIEDLNLTGSHFLISIDSKGNLIKNEQGMPELRICNFQFLRRLQDSKTNGE